MHDVQSTTGATRKEVCAASLMALITIEKFATRADVSEMTKDRKCKAAVTMTDDYMDDPVFMLVVGRVYRLRVALRHKHRNQARFRRISAIILKAPDGEEVPAGIEEITEACDGHEVVALLDTKSLKSERFRRVSPMFGSLEQKYNMMEVIVVVEIQEAETTQEVELSRTIVCCMAASEQRLVGRRLASWIGDKWKRAPQGMRDAKKVVVTAAAIAQSL